MLNRSAWIASALVVASLGMATRGLGAEARRGARLVERPVAVEARVYVRRPPPAAASPAETADASPSAPVCAPGLHFEPGRMCIPDVPLTPEASLAAVTAVLSTLTAEDSTAIVNDVWARCGWESPSDECKALTSRMYAFPYDARRRADDDTGSLLAYADTVDTLRWRLADPALKGDAAAWARMTRNIALFPARMASVIGR